MEKKNSNNSDILNKLPHHTLPEKLKELPKVKKLSKMKKSDDEECGCDYGTIITFGIMIGTVIIVITVIVTIRIYKTYFLQSQKKTTDVEDDFYLDNFIVLTEIRNKTASLNKTSNLYQLESADITAIGPTLDNTLKNLKDDNLKEICILGIKLLHAYFKDVTNKNYYKKSEKIVSSILEVIKKYNMSEKINKNNIELFTVDLPHLFVMYEIIARIENNLNVERSETADKLIENCHNYINRVIGSNLESKYNNTLEPKDNFINSSAPYFLTTFLHCGVDSNKLYQEAYKSKKIRLLNKYLMHEDKNKEVNDQYGVLREDDAVLLTNKLPNYSKYIELINKIKYRDFYAAVYDTLDLPGNLYKSAQVILNKFIHSNVKYLPFGLFSLNSNLINKEEQYYWNFGNSEGITLVPSIGVGIYKTEQFMFPIRIQLKNVPICFINDAVTDNNYAIAVMQLRTMYLTTDKDNYNGIDLSDWNILKRQTGIMTQVVNRTYLSLKADVSKLYTPKVNGYNYIGQIPKDNLMFWRNNYTLTLNDNKEISVEECGVACENGISIHYKIKSNFYGNFLYKPNNSALDFYIPESFTPLTTDEGDKSYPLYSGSEQTFSWNMSLKNQTLNISHEYNSVAQEQKFTVGGKKYKVTVEDKDPELIYYVVQIGEGKNPKLLIGSMRAKKDDTIKRDGKIYKRNETLMYEN